jgi:hypothetical protein
MYLSSHKQWIRNYLAMIAIKMTDILQAKSAAEVC